MVGHTGPCNVERGGEDKCVACRAREPLTADTITNAEIGKLLVEYLYAKPVPDSYGVDLCDRALGRQSRYKDHDPALTPDPSRIRQARARCAAILNARAEAR